MKLKMIISLFVLTALAVVAAEKAKPTGPVKFSVETKRKLARWALDNRALLIFEHHPEIEAGYLQATKRPDRFRLEPVAING